MGVGGSVTWMPEMDATGVMHGRQRAPGFYKSIGVYLFVKFLVDPWKARIGVFTNFTQLHPTTALRVFLKEKFSGGGTNF